MKGVPVTTGILRSGKRAGGKMQAVTHDVARLRTAIANVYLVGRPGAGDRAWTLVDAGIYGSARRIRAAAEERFGHGARPNAIILTHGHFDHVGALRELADLWSVPVYAHPMELPYITGQSSYPPPDPSVGGGAMATLSWMYPRGPVDVRQHAQPLPDDGSVPGMTGWSWIFTPGHTPGHISLFRESDRLLIAGDAIVTTRQESMAAAFSEPALMHGPPAYFTPDWERAELSVARLAGFEPEIVAAGHGPPLRGLEMRAALHALSMDFRHLGMPRDGRYVGDAAEADATGVIYVPPERAASRRVVELGMGGAAVAGALLALVVSRQAARRRAYAEGVQLYRQSAAGRGAFGRA